MSNNFKFSHIIKFLLTSNRIFIYHHLHTARNIPFELNSIEYSPEDSIAIIPPDSADKKIKNRKNLLE